MIDDVISGTIYFADNVLGSYANNYPMNDKYYIIYTADITTVMSRSMIFPVISRNERSAKLFIDHAVKTVYDPSLQNNLYSSNFNRFEENTIDQISLGPG